jgi:hypothetical protein
MKILSWILSIIVAAILLQTLYFKFTGSVESLYIFEKTGLGDAGRIGSGIVELFASIALLIPRTRAIGAILALGTICGALFFHLTSLGIEVMGDGGTLFYLALAVFASSIVLLILHRKEIPIIGKRFK